MTNLSLGYSPCPNDTFIFYAMTHGSVDTGNLNFTEVLLDVETLNQKAIKSELDITKVSCHALGYVRDTYCLLGAGGAIGRGCGPLVIAKKDFSMKELRYRRVAIPGRLTTAYLLLQLYDRSFMTSDIVVMPFDAIIDAIEKGEVDAGLVIHESRFTYPLHGLREIIDLGEWWERDADLPVPLGGIITKRSLGDRLNHRINAVLRESVEYALQHPSDPGAYIKKHSRELSEDVIQRHIQLYVNDFSVDIGQEGRKAIEQFLSRAADAGLIPKSESSVFL